MKIDDINALIVSFLAACVIIAGPVLLAVTLSKPEPDLSSDWIFTLVVWTILSFVITAFSVFCLMHILRGKKK